MQRLTTATAVMLLMTGWLFSQSKIGQDGAAEPVSAQVPSPVAATTTTAAPRDSTHLVITRVSAPIYPEQARNNQIQGQVWVHLAIDENGNVVKTEPISGDPVLLGAAMDAMKKWKFAPYIQGGHPVRVSTKMHYDFAFKDKVTENPKMPQRIINSSIPSSNSSQTAATDEPNAPAATADAAGKPAILRLNQGVSNGLLMHQVAPVYPESARRNRVQGTVVLEAIIGKDGRIKDLKSISGPSIELEQAAMGAVQQWRYRPYLLNGEPMEVQFTINVNFRVQ